MLRSARIGACNRKIQIVCRGCRAGRSVLYTVRGKSFDGIREPGRRSNCSRNHVLGRKCAGANTTIDSCRIVRRHQMAT